MSQPIYKRILLKLSGEALQGDEGFGIDPSILDRMALEIKELIEMGVEVGVVLGGGNLFRGAKLAKAGMNRVVGDHMGMLATVMNGLAMRDALHRADVNAKLMSAFQLMVFAIPITGLKRLKCCVKNVWSFSQPVQVVHSLQQILQHAYVVSKLKLISC